MESWFEDSSQEELIGSQLQLSTMDQFQMVRTTQAGSCTIATNDHEAIGSAQRTINH
ncbi:hypothetical protein [Shewanella pneumatophori]|uniref:Uncharacterized protein n=1 Tax=Shewanella pneumatophori TaxID=314092 RepID=A0A9X1ZKD8_9GAMM|nr:hypothetical protein [Shewanella pneumatophori]MCL1141070.1 hypothetical protein [Shewanella pneumatophori]